MKKLSIKARVTLWYTSFMVAVLLATAGLLFLTTRSLSRQQLNQQLVNAVTDLVGDVHFRYGELESSKLDFYQGGVSLFVYDVQGYLVAPKVNKMEKNGWSTTFTPWMAPPVSGSGGSVP